VTDPRLIEGALARAERAYDIALNEKFISLGPGRVARLERLERHVNELQARLDEIRSSGNVAPCRFAEEGCDGWAYDVYATGPLCPKCLRKFTNQTQEGSTLQ